MQTVKNAIHAEIEPHSDILIIPQNTGIFDSLQQHEEQIRAGLNERFFEDDAAKTILISTWSTGKGTSRTLTGAIR